MEETRIARLRTLVAIAGLFGVAALLMLAGSAEGASSEASVSGSFLDVGPPSFGDPQRHEIRISYAGAAYRASDSAGVVAGFGCDQVNPTTVTCPDDGIDAVVPFGGAAGDEIIVESIGAGDRTGLHGFGGNDRLVGGPGDDQMFGYAADDTLIGNAGADRMLGGPHGQETGQDTLDGGPGPTFSTATPPRAATASTR